MTVRKSMHIGVYAMGTGNHIAGWRYPGATDSGEDIEAFKLIARSAERGKLDFIFVGDNLAYTPNDHPGSIARIEPLVLQSALAMHTTHLGLIGTASSTFNAPYNIARRWASLDHVSNGRAGWNVVTTTLEDAAGNFGVGELPAHDLRYERASEFLEVVLGLWDSWEEGARVHNIETGVYVDASKIHALDHKGPYFSVKGPLNQSRTPQGRPVIVQAGSSTAGQRFAARFAEVIFTVQHNREESAKFCADMRRQMAEFGRGPDACRILVGFMPIVGRTAAEARETMEHLMKYVDSTSALATMSVRVGADVSKYPLDGPVPDFKLDGNVQGRVKVMLTEARRRNLTLRDLYNNMAVARGYFVSCGSANEVADEMEGWVAEDAADGFMLMPAYFPGPFDDVIDMVVPELQRRGVFRTEYEGRFLRDHLGLAIPSNRHTVANRTAAE